MMGNGYGPGPWMMQAGYWPRVGASGGWMGPWMMGWGGAYGPGPWMMHGGWMAPWSMGWGGEYGPAPGMMGGGWIDPWTVSWSGGCPGGWGPARPANFHLTVDQVKAGMGRWLSATGNPHVKLGAVAAKGSDTITADIVTTDNGGLVQRYEIDRRTGAIEPEGE